MTRAPVLFIIFNRPEQTRRSFERIRAARPSTLYVVADGPRADRPGEAALCERTRAEVQVDWPCEVVRDFAAANLGCKRRIVSGITAAFEREERLIILEDDCVADPSFFPYCDELLDRYADDMRVMMVSGNNLQRGAGPRENSYYFSRYPHCCGWATWRRAWRLFDPDMQSWPRLRRTEGLERIFDEPSARAYWTRHLDMGHSHEVDSWAYPWALTCWTHGGLTALPKVNLIQNIGFAPGATHVADETMNPFKLAGSLEFPLDHPPRIERDAEADAFTQSNYFEKRLPGRRERLEARLPKRVRRWMGRLRPAEPASELERLAVLRDGPRHVPGTAAFRGWALTYHDGPSFYWQLREIFFDGCYDVDLPGPAPRILDLGGNVGVAALRLRLLAPDARLTVYEAEPGLARTLERNLRAAGDTTTEVVTRAVWVHDGEVGFASAGDDAGQVAPEAERRVPCVDVATLCRERIDLLKMDVEGAEHELLPRLAATRTLENVRRLIVECHLGGQRTRLDSLLRLLADAGMEYRILRAIDQPEVDETPARSGFAAVRVWGALCLVYAWRPEP